jgi:hypothetical protein
MAVFMHHKSMGTFRFRCSNSGGAQGDISTDVTADNNWHTVKIFSNVTADPTPAGTGVGLFIDGILKGTRSTAIGYFSENVAPIFSTARSITSSGTSSINVGYCEAWNTL